MMDARLRILERQAQANNTAADWEKYARALQKSVNGGRIDEDIPIWAAKLYQLNGSRAGETVLALFATEHEAQGFVLNAVLDAVGEIIYDPDIDEEWYKSYQELVKLTEEGNYEKAWDIQSRLNIEGLPFDSTVEKEFITRCGPNIAPTSCTIRIW